MIFFVCHRDKYWKDTATQINLTKKKQKQTCAAIKINYNIVLPE